MRYLITSIILIISINLHGQATSEHLSCGTYIIRGLFQISKQQQALIKIYPHTRREATLILGHLPDLKIFAYHNHLVEIKISVIHPGEIHQATINFQELSNLSTQSQVYKSPYELIEPNDCLIFADKKNANKRDSPLIGTYMQDDLAF